MSSTTNDYDEIEVMIYSLRDKSGNTVYFKSLIEVSIVLTKECDSFNNEIKVSTGFIHVNKPEVSRFFRKEKCDKIFYWFRYDLNDDQTDQTEEKDFQPMVKGFPGL